MNAEFWLLIIGAVVQGGVLVATVVWAVSKIANQANILEVRLNNFDQTLRDLKYVVAEIRKTTNDHAGRIRVLEAKEREE